MRKTMFRWLIALAIVVPCMVVAVFAVEERKVTGSGTCGTKVMWTLYEDGELVISGSGEMKNYEYGKVPWLAYYQYVTEVKGVTIESGVTSVGDNALNGCDSLSLVTLPDSVTRIGDYAFRNCYNLSSVAIPDSVTDIGRHAFSNNGLVEICVAEDNNSYCDIDGVLYNKEKTVLIQYPREMGGRSYIIPDSVTVIGDGAFYNSKISSVIIPNSVTSIEANAFYLCQSIRQITIPAGVKTIGDMAFACCTNLTRVDFQGRMPTRVGSDMFDSGRELSVYYHEGTSGWPTGGSWQGHPLVMQPHTKVVVPAVAATCGKDGLTEGECCSVCETVLLEQTVVPATGHTMVVDAAVEATCKQAGLTEGSRCSACGEVLVAQVETELTEHTPVVDPAVEATCAETGLTEGSHCDVCGEVLVAQQIVNKITHTVAIDNPKDPTCTEVGYSGNGMHCSVCGEVLLAQTEIPALGHVEVTDEGTEATCATAGLSDGKHCSRCNEVLLAQTEIPALGHDIVAHEGKAPTTESVGWEAYETCSRCDYTTYKELPKLEEKPVAPATRFTFSLEVIKTIKVDGQNVDICRWVWTPIYN